MNKNVKNTIIGLLGAAFLSAAGWWIKGVNATQDDVTAIKAIAPLIATNTQETKDDVKILKDSMQKVEKSIQRVEDKLGVTENK